MPSWCVYLVGIKTDQREQTQSNHKPTHLCFLSLPSPKPWIKNFEEDPIILSKLLPHFQTNKEFNSEGGGCRNKKNDFWVYEGNEFPTFHLLCGSIRRWIPLEQRNLNPVRLKKQAACNKSNYPSVSCACGVVYWYNKWQRTNDESSSSPPTPPASWCRTQLATWKQNTWLVCHRGEFRH